MFTSNMSTGNSPPMSGAVAANITDNIRKISPVILDRTWSKMGRFLFMLSCTSFGCTTNGFFVAAFFVEHTLMRLGNVFLACVGVADMLITTIIMPVCTVIMLSGQWDGVYICKILQLIAITSTYCYSVCFMLVAADDYYRFCQSVQEYEVFISMRIGIITTLIFILSASLSACGVYLDLDYDYCERVHYGNFYFRIATWVIFHGAPGVLTVICLIYTSIAISKRARGRGHYKRSQMYERDNAINVSNIVAYLLYVICWLPYTVVVFEQPGTTDDKYYGTVWIGILRSIITSFIYGTVNRNFRRAYDHIFNYCFCKNTISSSFTRRRRRATEARQGARSVKVHILHQAIKRNSPQRRAPAICETHNL